MSDIESEDEESQTKCLMDIQKEIEGFKKNPETAGMFVSGWDDDTQGIDLVKNPKANPITHILHAAENGDVGTIKELLSTSKSLVHARDNDGYTPLHRACYNNHLSAVSYLISAGANVHAKTEMGWTPLHSACNWNVYKVVARLLASGADPSAVSDGGQTPMHLASAISHCKSTLVLLLLRDDCVEIAEQKTFKTDDTPKSLAFGHGIYGPLYEMALPAGCYIKNIAFTNNPYIRENSLY